MITTTRETKPYKHIDRDIKLHTTITRLSAKAMWIRKTNIPFENSSVVRLSSVLQEAPKINNPLPDKLLKVLTHEVVRDISQIEYTRQSILRMKSELLVAKYINVIIFNLLILIAFNIAELASNVNDFISVE